MGNREREKEGHKRVEGAVWANGPMGKRELGYIDIKEQRTVEKLSVSVPLLPLP